MPDVGITVQWTAFLAALATVITGLYRFYSRVHHANKEDATAHEATAKVIGNLQSEITRLNGIINELYDHIRDLQSAINDLRNMEIDASGDFGSLKTIAHSFPCIKCQYQGEAFAQLSDIITRMEGRREKRKKLLRVEGANGVQLIPES